MACLGGLVVTGRPQRRDVRVLAPAACVMRSLWLASRVIPAAPPENGALLLFALHAVDPENDAGRAGRGIPPRSRSAPPTCPSLRTNGLPVARRLLVPRPLIDRIRPRAKHHWTARPPDIPTGGTAHETHRFRCNPRRTARAGGSFVRAFWFLRVQGGHEAFNRASQVVLIRDGNRTVLTMATTSARSEGVCHRHPVPTRIERGRFTSATKR